MTGLTFTHSLVCDDIRQEANGKFIFIGVYTSSFIPPHLPYATQLAFGVWGRAVQSGEFHCKFEITLEPSNTPVGGGEIEFEIGSGDERDPLFIPLPKFPIKVTEPGFIVVKESVTGQEVTRLRIAEPRHASAPVPPSSQSQPDAPAS